MEQDQGDPLVAGESGNGTLQDTPLVSGQSGILPFIGSGHIRFCPVVIIGTTQVGEQRPAIAITLQVVEAEVTCHRFQPSTGGLAVFQFGPVFPGTQERLLSHVLRLGFMAQETNGRGVDHVLIVQNKTVKARRVVHVCPSGRSEQAWPNHTRNHTIVSKKMSPGFCFSPVAGFSCFHARDVTAELQQLLRETSRSFYLTVRVLPTPVRSSIGIAYLLARATDTVADTELVPVERRLATLESLRERIMGNSRTPLDCGEFIRSPSATVSPGERRLLERIEAALKLFEGFPSEEQALIRQVLTTITGGQALDLRRFGGAMGTSILGLETAVELDDYTYCVAGCVGEFWTRLTRLRCFPEAKVNDALLLANGRQFGCGLQLVNILRDLPKDLANGRCYLPRIELEDVYLAPGDLTRPEVWPRLKPVYNRWWHRAMGNLNAGWQYTNQLPRNQYRLRLACAWPVLLGVGTLAKLAQANPLDSRQRVKVSRQEVRQILLGSIWRLPFRRAWDRQFQKYGGI